ncbi:MAG: ribonuclease III domain-containing protein [Eubacteriales bacterium]|nr:ribonuclease III domain-containing protein [Eubacteriales bacterium]MDD4475700.1 ribonuclease III domain-containing protein [Eubacteriales bacterium]
MEEAVRKPDFNLPDYSPAALAYLGDAVYEILVRKYIVGNGDVKASTLNDKARVFVTACAQSAAVDIITPMLSETELAIYKSGRNLNSAKAPRAATVGEYRRATGLEVLFGYLYLSEKQERADELFDAIVKGCEKPDCSYNVKQ